MRQGTETHCPQGHPYSGGNLYVNPSTGGRMCRECKRDQGREYMRRKRAAAKAPRRLTPDGRTPPHVAKESHRRHHDRARGRAFHFPADNPLCEVPAKLGHILLHIAGADYAEVPAPPKPAPAASKAAPAAAK